MVPQYDIYFVFDIGYFISVFFTLMFCALHEHSLLNVFTLSIDSYPLFIRIFERIGLIFGIYCDERRIVTSIKTGVFSLAEIIVFVNDIVQVLAKRSECNSKILLFLLQINQRSKKAGYQVVSAFWVQCPEHLFLEFRLLFFQNLSFVDFLTILVLCLLYRAFMLT